MALLKPLLSKAAPKLSVLRIPLLYLLLFAREYLDRNSLISLLGNSLETE